MPTLGLRASLVFALLLFATGAQGADYRLLRLDGRLVKWGAPSLGAGGAITYAFVSRPTEIPGARNCRQMVPLDEILHRAAIPQDRFREEVRGAFEAWAGVADLTFTYVEDAEKADILIGAQGRPRGTAYADVRPEAGDAAGVARIAGASICLNPAAAWTSGLGADPAAFNLRYVLAHEIGHTLGLDHPGRSGQLMAYRYDEEMRELRPGDIAGIVVLYGARRGGSAVAARIPATPSPAGFSPPQ